MKTNKFGDFFSRMSIRWHDGSSRVPRFVDFWQDIETTSFGIFRSSVTVGLFIYKFCPFAVVPALQSIWFYNTQSEAWYEHFLTKRSGNNEPSSLSIRCVVSCIQSSPIFLPLTHFSNSELLFSAWHIFPTLTHFADKDPFFVVTFFCDPFFYFWSIFLRVSLHVNFSKDCRD